MFRVVIVFILLVGSASAQLPSPTGWTELNNTRLNDVCAATHGFPAFSGAGGCGGITNAWSGGAYDSLRDRMIIWGGGHTDYLGNELYAVNFATSPPTLTRINDPGPSVPNMATCSEATDGKPTSRHTYNGMAYIAHADKMFIIGGGIACNAGAWSQAAWTFDFPTGVWTQLSVGGATIPGIMGPSQSCIYDPVTQKVFINAAFQDGWSALYSYTYAPGGGTYQLVSVPEGSGGSLAQNSKYVSLAIDQTRRKLWVIGLGIESVYDLNCVSGCTATPGGSSGGGTVIAAPGPGLSYDPVLDSIVGWAGGNSIYRMNPSTKIWTQVTPAGATPGAAIAQGTFGRWQYSATQNAYVVYNLTSNDAWSLRLSGAPPADTTPPVVSISNPPNGAVVSGTVTVSANASDNIAVSGVQFKLNGSNLGTEDTSSPYSIFWDSTSVSNGPYTLTAIARDSSSNTTTSSGISITVSNTGPPPPIIDTITISETSGSTQTNRVISISKLFKQGEITQYAQCGISGGSLLTTQCDMKNRWSDGSLKFAIVSFVLPTLAANSSATIVFTNQSTGNNTGFLTQSDMQAAGYNFDGTIQMVGANTQTISARTMLNNNSFRYWLQGPIVTAVILEDRATRTYDVDFGDGSKALHPIFEAWFYPQGNLVDLGYTIENCWTSNTTLNSMRDETYSLTLKSGQTSPVTRLTQASFVHIGKSRWHKRYFMGSSPGAIRVDYNDGYLVNTGAIPHYDSTIVLDPALLTSMYSSWSAADKTIPGNVNGIGMYAKDLDGPGEAYWIGLLNTWDTMYILSMDDRMREMTLGNADLIGRIPWHFREADTLAGSGDFFDAVGTGSVGTQGRILSVNARRTITLDVNNFNAACGSQYAADLPSLGAVNQDGWAAGRSHQPDGAYLAYLMSGRYYYLEELQMQAAYNIGYRVGCFSQTYNRQGDNGFMIDSQVRGDAWGFRTVEYAGFISPDGQPEQAYFLDKVQNNIAMWEGAHDLTLSYAAKSSQWNFGNTGQRDPNGPSPLGEWQNRDSQFVQAPMCTDGRITTGISPWEENFLISVFGLGRQFGYATDNVLRFTAKLKFHNLLDPASLKYLVESYRIPGYFSANNNWAQNYTTYATAWCPLPTAWVLGGSVDHGYGFIALAAISFLTPYTVDGYSGINAWNFFQAQKPEQNRFATVSPKWAITPLVAAAPPPTPPTPPTNLKVLGP